MPGALIDQDKGLRNMKSNRTSLPESNSKRIERGNNSLVQNNKTLSQERSGQQYVVNGQGKNQQQEAPYPATKIQLIDRKETINQAVPRSVA